MEKTMAQINPAFTQKVYELTAFAYKNGIDCPALSTLNEWTIGQLGRNTSAAATPTPRIRNRTAAKTAKAATPGNFDDAVLAAVKSSAAGVGIDDLSAILKPHGRPNNQIGTALARLVKKGLIEKRAEPSGDAWLPTTGATIDTTITRGRGRPAANNGEAQQQAAA